MAGTAPSPIAETTGLGQGGDTKSPVARDVYAALVAHIERQIAAAPLAECRIVYVTADGRKGGFGVPVGGVVPIPLTPEELRIVDLFRDIEPDDSIKGTVIARAVGWPEGTLKKLLAGLAKREILRADKPPNGGYFRGRNYPATE